MVTAHLKKIIDNIEKLGITDYMVQCNNSYIVYVNKESCRAYYDWNNEQFYYFRVSNNASSQYISKGMNLEVLDFDIVERVIVTESPLDIIALAKEQGLTLTDELTTWLKTQGSLSGIYPRPNPVSELDGTPVKKDTPYIPKANVSL